MTLDEPTTESFGSWWTPARLPNGVSTQDDSFLCCADVSVIAEGQVNYHSTKRLPYGGEGLEKLLASLLQLRGIHCSNPQQLKEMCASAAGLPATTAEVASPSIAPDHQGYCLHIILNCQYHANRAHPMSQQKQGGSLGSLKTRLQTTL